MHSFKQSFGSRKVGKAEIVTLVLYVAGLMILSCFHELYFDETQAWLIARSASYREILFEVPHYEGHPPLWHLLLSLFAKTGAPVDFSLHLVNILFCTAAMALLLLRSPFPKGIRCLLPFHYYFFYQYGVLSRPYSLLMLAMVLAAMTYTNRNRKPFRYVLSLMLLCLTSAFGIMIAGGLCMVWTAEILAEKRRSHTLAVFWRDRRFWALLLILLLAVVLFAMLLPADDCYYKGKDTSLLDKCRAQWFIPVTLPFECWAGTYISYVGANATTGGLIASCIGGVLTWAALLMLMAKNRKLWTFLLPFGMFTLFLTFWYTSAHYLGVCTMFLVFLFWILSEAPGGIQLPDAWRTLPQKFDSPLTLKAIWACGGALLLAPIAYSGISGYHDVVGNYGVTPFAAFIKEHHLEDKKLMVTWQYGFDEVEKGALYPQHFMPSDHPPISENMTNITGMATVLLPYFDHNIFMNHNIQCPDDLYMHYQYAPDETAVLRQWEAQGLPDFIFGWCPIDEVYSDAELEGVRYVAIEECKVGLIYKTAITDATYRIFIRNDLLDDYPQFTPLYE